MRHHPHMNMNFIKIVACHGCKYVYIFHQNSSKTIWIQRNAIFIWKLSQIFFNCNCVSMKYVFARHRIRESNHDVNFKLCVYTIECVWKLYFGNDFLYGNNYVVFCACAIFFPWHLLHISFSHLAADVCLCGIHIIWCIIILRNFPTQTRCNWLSNKSIWWRMNSKIANSYASAFSLNGFDFALFFVARVHFPIAVHKILLKLHLRC